MTPAPNKAAGRLLGWVGWASGDAVGRLVLLSIATIVFSRLLSPEDFGISALVLAIIAAAGLFAGAPFEEALVQRRVLRNAHLRTVFAFSCLVALLLCVASVLVAPLVARGYGVPQMTALLPVAMLSVFFQGHGDLATALARRRRRFNDIAAAGLVSHLVAVPVAIVMAMQGAGVWSLVAMRLVVVVVRSVILQARVRYPLMPGFSLLHLAQLGRFASIAFLDRLADNLTYLAFNNVVGAFFGLTVLGHLNMAMRLVEPIRGAIVATSHNLVFSYFKRTSSAAGPSEADRDGSIRLLAFIIAPVFVGLAAVMPVLLPLVAGPGWEDATAIAVCLSLGAALTLPARLILTSLSARGRPEYGLAASVSGLLVTFSLLLLLRNEAAVVTGAARLAGDAAQALFAGLVPMAGWAGIARLRLLVPAWIISGAMGLTTGILVLALRPYGAVLALVLSVPAGMILHILLMRCFERTAFFQLYGIVRGNGGPAMTAEQAR